MRIPFAIQSYQSRSLPLSAQRCVNLYAEAAPKDARTPVILHGTPGLKAFSTLATNPVRGVIRMADTLYAVAGTTAYQIDSVGTATSLGTVPGTGLVKMAHNGTQILCLTGTGATDAYVITASTVTQVTDADFPGATSVQFIDGYFILTKTGTGQFIISGSYDGLAYAALDFATAEGDPDNLVGVIVDHREVWLFGAQTAEIWFNSGASPFPFERAAGAFVERGCIAAGTLAKVDNSVFWVGDDRIVYRADGYTPKRISHHGIEKALSDAGDLSGLVAFEYAQEGHAFYTIKKPGAFTFVYDVASGLWHERQSKGRPDWRVSSHAEVYDKQLVGDDTSGAIYELDLDTYTENGETLIASATAPTIWADGASATMENLLIDFETGVGLATGQGSNPQAMLDWSDDGGRTWSNEHWAGIGKVGGYESRARWDRMGQFRQRTLRVSVSDPVKRGILGAYAEIEGGRL